jgi:dihydroneopterin aldolase
MSGLVPRRYHIRLEELELQADIGFHACEIGVPQRLLVTIDLAVACTRLPIGDAVATAWNYDTIRTHVQGLVAGRRFNLQETVAAAIFHFVAALPDVEAVRVETRKPDIYPDASAVGVVIASD